MSAQNGKGQRRQKRQKRRYETESRLTWLETEMEHRVTEANMEKAIGTLREDIQRMFRSQDRWVIGILIGVVLNVVGVLGAILTTILK